MISIWCQCLKFRKFKFKPKYFLKENKRSIADNDSLKPRANYFSKIPQIEYVSLVLISPYISRSLLQQNRGEH